LSGKGLLKLMASIPVRFTEISIFNWNLDCLIWQIVQHASKCQQICRHW
jgi:hypothetical protein